MPTVHQAVCLYFLDGSMPSWASWSLFIYSDNKHVSDSYTVSGSVLDAVIEWRETPQSRVVLDQSF